MNLPLSPPRTALDWRQLALEFAALPPGAVPAASGRELARLKDLAWDVASHAAFWRTVQLPSLGPGLLPWMVVLLAFANAALSGRWRAAWPDLSSPFFLWPSLWLLGWYALTLGLAAIRHARARRQVVRLGAQLGLLPPSAPSAY
jgi:hypothetical protein